MTSDEPRRVFQGELSGPPGLAAALRAAGADAPDDPGRLDLLRDLKLADVDGLVDELAPVAATIGAPLLRADICLRLHGDVVEAEGWLDREQSVLSVPASTGDDAVTQLQCFPTAELSHRLARFFVLGPRPLGDEVDIMVVKRIALQEILGSALPTDRARATLEIHDAAADEAVSALCDPQTLHWRIELRDAATNGDTFVRCAEALDARDRGLWLVGPTVDETMVMLLPARTTQVWRLLTTLLPSAEETAAVEAAAQNSGSARNSS